MFLLVLKDLSLLFGSILLLNVLMGLFLMPFSFTPTASAQRTQAQQNTIFGWFVLLLIPLMLLRVLVWPIHSLFNKGSKKDAWWARGWWPLSFYAVLGVCLLLAGWFL